MDLVESAQFSDLVSPSLLRVEDSKDAANEMTQQGGLELSDKTTPSKPKIEISHMDFFYGSNQALFKVNLTIPEHKVTAFIGPSGCGKTTLLRCLNRLNDLVDGSRVEGKILIDGLDIYGSDVDVTDLRTRVGDGVSKS